MVKLLIKNLTSFFFVFCLIHVEPNLIQAAMNFSNSTIIYTWSHAQH